MPCGLPSAAARVRHDCEPELLLVRSLSCPSAPAAVRYSEGLASRTNAGKFLARWGAWDLSIGDTPRQYDRAPLQNSYRTAESHITEGDIVIGRIAV